MSVYTEFYGDIYGGGGVAGLVLGLKAELYTGQWTRHHRLRLPARPGEDPAWPPGRVVPDQPGVVLDDAEQPRRPVHHPQPGRRLLRHDRAEHAVPAVGARVPGRAGHRAPVRRRHPVRGILPGLQRAAADRRTSTPASTCGSTTTSQPRWPGNGAATRTDSGVVPAAQRRRHRSPCTGSRRHRENTATSTPPLPYLGRIMIRASPAISDAVTVTLLHGAHDVRLADPARRHRHRHRRLRCADTPPGRKSRSACKQLLLPRPPRRTARQGVRIPAVQLQRNPGRRPAVLRPDRGARQLHRRPGQHLDDGRLGHLNDRCYRFHGEMSRVAESGRPVQPRRLLAGHRVRRAAPPQPGHHPRAVGDAPRHHVDGRFGVRRRPGLLAVRGLGGQPADRLRVPRGPPMYFSGTPDFQEQAGSPSADSVFACSAQLPTPARPDGREPSPGRRRTGAPTSCCRCRPAACPATSPRSPWSTTRAAFR